MNLWDDLTKTLEAARAAQDTKERRRLLIDAQENLFALFDQATRQKLKEDDA